MKNVHVQLFMYRKDFIWGDISHCWCWISLVESIKDIFIKLDIMAALLFDMQYCHYYFVNW